MQVTKAMLVKIVEMMNSAYALITFQRDEITFGDAMFLLSKSKSENSK